MGLIRLGPFELQEVIGRGGMATVWRGVQVHPTVGEAVAVKVLTGRRTREPHFAEALAREVAALATLDHPHIVTPYDYGLVPEQVWPAESDLVSGAPYLVMELARHGTLAGLAGRCQWPFLRNALLGVLDGLGHAHARGMIHRDVKPANVLLREDSSVTLTDFGLVHVLERADQEQLKIAGTPLFMAPEQVMARWRDHGPWTDLYAVGVMGWLLAAGTPPFRCDDDVVALMRLHVTAPLPEFRSRCEVPDGFEAWLRRLLDKNPRARFRRAADAAWALRGLGGVAESVVLPDPRGTSEAEVTMEAATVVLVTPDGFDGLTRRGEVGLFSPVRLAADEGARGTTVG